MPIKKCTVGGKNGYQWGDSGKCYTGQGAREKAAKQGRAIESQKSKGSRMYQLLENLESVLASKPKE